MNLEHLIITRYNLGLYDGSYLHGPKFRKLTLSPDDWMADRLKLFRRYCVPSLHSQSCRQFRWIVVFDKHTPAVVVQQTTAGVRCIPLLFGGKNWVQGVIAWIVKHVKAPWLLTSRLDNDDALHVDYVRDIQRAAAPRLECLCFPTGWRIRGNSVHTVRWSSNAFISLVEPMPEIGTVCSGPHQNAKWRYPYRELPAGRWLRVIHEHNLGSRAQGRPVSKGALRKGFPFLFNAEKA